MDDIQNTIDKIKVDKAIRTDNKTEAILIETTSNLMKTMGFNAVVEIVKNDFNGNVLNIISIQSTDDLGLLIGKNGQNIRALEHLVRILTFKNLQEKANFILDINDYRKSRANYVMEQAKTIVNRVRETKKAEALFPMSSYERRIVHMELASYSDIITESIGEEPHRRVVVKLLI